MATYIQGGDIFVYLRANWLTYTTGSFSGLVYVVFEGDYLPGDTIIITIPGDSTYGHTIDPGETESDIINNLVGQIDAGIYSASTYGPFGFTTTAPELSVEIITHVNDKIACTKSDTITTENEMIEITQTDQYNTAFLPSFQGKKISVEQALVMDVASGQIDSYSIRQWADDQTLLMFKYEIEGDTTEEGQCYITSVSISGGVNTGALATFEMQVTGATTLTQI